MSFDINQGLTGVNGWIKNGLDKDAITFSENFGRNLAEAKLSTNQIRNVFGEVRRIQLKGKSNGFDSEVLLLKPKLAYSKARNKSAEPLQKVLSKGIDAIFEDSPENKYQRFENFANFFESILAYHKAYGGN
jgi:CRISPR-associated protein Csm2